MLQFLVSFFHGAGEGVPLEDLRNAKYLGTQERPLSEFNAAVLIPVMPAAELIEARMYYEWSVDDLMRASVEACELRGPSVRYRVLRLVNDI